MASFEIVEMSDVDLQVVNDINRQHPRGPMMIPCSYTISINPEESSPPSLLAEDLLFNPTYLEWKLALDAVAPMNTRPRYTAYSLP